MSTSERKTQSHGPDVELGAGLQEPQARLPAVIEHTPPPRRRRGRVAVIAALLLIGTGAGVGWFWWQQHQLRLPPGIALGNGRLEADEIDIDTKFAGRIAQLFVDEGDMVKAGQLVAMMDTRDLEASLKKAEALVSQAQRALDEAKANLVQQQTQVKLAQRELERTTALVPRGFATLELLDQRRQQISAANAAENAATQRVAGAQHALDAYPEHVIPAKVVFVASQAQFTPKTVETKAERDKLMFRIRVRIDPERLKGREEMVRSGLPGLAHVRTNPSVSWPASLQPSPPPSVPTPVTQ
jgi:multidrug efflux pump subunit AcrA (membrane-fusion protein)